MNIEIISMDGCGPCNRLKTALKDMDIEFKDYDLKSDGDRIEELRSFAREAGIRTVPVVFNDGAFIGDSQTSLPIIESLNKEVK